MSFVRSPAISLVAPNTFVLPDPDPWGPPIRSIPDYAAELGLDPDQTACLLWNILQDNDVVAARRVPGSIRLEPFVLGRFYDCPYRCPSCTVDGYIANIGSANLNSRSTDLDEEVNLVVMDESLVATLDRHFDEDLERSTEIEAGRWDERSGLQRTYERVSIPLKRFF